MMPAAGLLKWGFLLACLTIGLTAFAKDKNEELFKSTPCKMDVADYTEHNVLTIDMETKKITVFDHEDKMNQPNGLAIGPDDTLYASDPNWKDGTGQVWKIDRKGKVTLVAGDMGTTNGIDV